MLLKHGQKLEKVTLAYLSVPSIGSMLLKPGTGAGRQRAIRDLSVPSIGSMLLKRRSSSWMRKAVASFSTLYRVDAIEATRAA